MTGGPARSASGPGDAASRSRALDKPPPPGTARPFRFPEATEARLSNGMAVHVASGAAFPLAAAVLVMKAGEAAAPPGGGGLPSLCAAALEGGTTSLSAREVALGFEDIGAGFHISTTWDATVLSVSCLAERFPRALALLGQVVREPAFEDDEFDRCKARRLATVRQRAMDPAALAADAHARFVFGRRSPYGRPLGGTAESLGALEPAGARAFAESSYGPGHAALIVAGDVGVEETLAAAEDAWGGWRPREPPADPAGARPVADGRRIHVLHRPGSVQSEIRTGHVGVSRAEPDYVALQVFNLILGGAFSSRLNLNLRERHGFTYGARSGFAARRCPGPFFVSTSVETAVTAPALREIFREIEDLARDGPTARDVEAATGYLAGVFPLKFQTLGQLAEGVARQFVYDLPGDYYRCFQDSVRAVTRAQVHRAGSLHVRPNELCTVVVGDAEKVREALAEHDFAAPGGAARIVVHEDGLPPDGGG